MRGEFIGVWPETWREIWLLLIDHEDVSEDTTQASGTAAPQRTRCAQSICVTWWPCQSCSPASPPI
jgi:hypothetical protein